MDLRDQLQRSLGATYTLERELGGGGMSRVFVADDVRLGRKIVIKVLAPDLAASISLERFEREIKVAASLQQANIVPVLSAGETDRLPYYTMPFVDGESLRHRLAQSGALPIADAIRILVDVARALSYAHERGVVHRDIKPDNVLLSGSTAVVTDFGIAKALVASRSRGDSAEETLTQIGTVVGTPAYMSPEQAASDPAIDRRTDIYAFGCLAFELLTGETPFAGRSPHKMLAAHITELPQSVLARRPDTPAPLADLVMRALAKDPDARPQSATDLIRVLEDAAVASGASMARASSVRHSLRRKAVMPAAAVVGAVALFYATVAGFGAAGIGPAASLRARGALGAREPLLIADFRVTGTDTNLANVVTEAVRANLNESNAFTLVLPSRIVAALGRMQRPATTRVEFALAQEIAQREGIKAIIDGGVTPLGAGYVIALRLVTADSGRELTSFHSVAPTPADLIKTIDDISRKLRGKIGESLKSVRATPALEDAVTASLPALRVFTEADRAFRVGDYPRAIALGRDAVAIDSTFADAWQLIEVAGANSTMSRGAIDSASAKVFRYRDRLPESVRLSVIASYYRTGQGRDRAKAADAYQRMFNRDSTAINAIFVAAMANNRRQFARAESLLVFATARDSNASFAYANLTIALVNQGKLDRARAVIATLRKRFPLFQSGIIRAAESAYQGGDLVQYRRLLDSMYRAPAPRIKGYGANHLALLELLGGRLRQSERFRLETQALDSAVGSPTPPIIDSLRRSFQDAWYLGENARAARRLDDALRAAPLKAIAAADRPDYEIATAYALAGRPDRARAVLRAFLAQADTSIVRDRKPEEHETLAYILLAERKPMLAVLEFRMADRRPDGPRDANPIRVLAQLGFAFDAANQPDSSIAMFERYKITPFNGHGDADGDSRYLAAVEKRLGELYEAKGDRARAVDAFAAFIGLWRNADPELQPKVAEARARLYRLRPESGRP